jgi:AraC family transcriptional regulator
MRQGQYQSACGLPENERNLLGADLARGWHGFPLAWMEMSPHQVNMGFTVEKTALLMIDSGSVQADLGYGQKSLACDLTPSALGLYTEGTQFHHSRWRWANARRVRLELDPAQLAGSGLVEETMPAIREAELVFRDEALAALMRGILAEVAAGSPNGPLFAESLCLGLVLHLQRRRSRRDPRRRERGKLTVSEVQRLEELVRTNLSSEICLGALAAATGFSTAQFVRLFKNTVGCTPYQYVMRARLERAKGLVAGTQSPLVEVAHATGFANQSHMTAAFVRAFGTPPAQMRREASSVERVASDYARA